MTEHIILIKWQHCEQYSINNSTDCASDEERREFFHHIEISFDFAYEFIVFSEKDTDKTVQTTGTTFFEVNSRHTPLSNSRGYIEFTPNEVSLMDKWYSFFDPLFVKESQFCSFEKFEQFPATFSETDNFADFGFTFVLRRSESRILHDRTVYTILDYLGDIGGLSSALYMIIQPIMSIFIPSLMMKSIMNENFKYDDVGASNKQNKAGSEANRLNLMQRMRNNLIPVQFQS